MDAITQFLTASFNDVWSFILNFLVFIVIAAVLFGWAWRSGRQKLIGFILSLYAGYALYIVFPYSSDILSAAGSTLMSLLLKIVILGAFVFISYLAIGRRSGGDYMGAQHWISAVLAILASGFILAVLYHTLGAKGAYSFTPSIDALFAPAEYFFWWFVAPLLGILFLAR